MRLSFLVLAALLAGCATEAKFKAQMDDLAGRSEADLVGRLGAPQHIYVTPDGSRILTYVTSETVQPQAAQYHPPPPQLTGGIYGGASMMYQPSAAYSQVPGPADTVTLSCTVSFWISNDRVATWRSQGNNCVAK
jgi:hypothetical protein